jgi:hypothetical protein
MGCERKISRDFRHKPRISDSVSCTFFPGLDPRTKIINEKKNTMSRAIWIKKKNATVKKWKIWGPGVGWYVFA